ncbi:SRPBCC family protein [Microbacterium chocolatum]|uniref:SRPBCC family protein n=1 Tax=Microbacterium aurantiacum TaxID=162393 RepID=UPI00338E8E36
MFTVAEKILIERDLEAVFAYLTDPANRSRWDTSVISEELTSPPPVQPGTTLRTRMRVMGREVEYDWQVTHFEPPIVMAARSSAGIMPTTLRFDFSPRGEACHVRAEIEASPGGMLRLVEPVVADTVRSTLAQGLARAKAQLEA